MLDRNLILENELVLLRPMSRQDFPFLQKLSAHPDMWIYFTHDLSIPEEFEQWAAGHFSADRLQFTVIQKSTGEIVGATAFGNYFQRDQRIEIGWTWLSKEVQGKGINPAMKKLMLDYCFEILKMKRVEIKTDVLNLPARKALQKIGAVEEGILRSHTLMTHGRRRDTIYYSFLEGEWEKSE
jgi:RimJ/RimL family protein N-acetyltransferase